MPSRPGHRDRTAPGAQGQLFDLEDSLDHRADLGLLHRQQPVGTLHHSDHRPEPGERLCQLQPNSATTEHDQRAGRFRGLDRLPIGPVAGVGEPGDRWADRRRTSGQHHPTRLCTPFRRPGPAAAPPASPAPGRTARCASRIAAPRRCRPSCRWPRSGSAGPPGLVGVHPRGAGKLVNPSRLGERLGRTDDHLAGHAAPSTGTHHRPAPARPRARPALRRPAGTPSPRRPARARARPRPRPLSVRRLSQPFKTL